jgi:hypothetical protein
MLIRDLITMKGGCAYAKNTGFCQQARQRDNKSCDPVAKSNSTIEKKKALPLKHLA